jgi:hypothetical protein
MRNISLCSSCSSVLGLAVRGTWEYPVAGSRSSTRRNKTKRTKATSPKVAEIVRLVHILTSDIGSGDGVVVGRGVARLLESAYRERGRPLPRWVKQLAGHFGLREASG